MNARRNFGFALLIAATLTVGCSEPPGKSGDPVDDNNGTSANNGEAPNNGGPANNGAGDAGGPSDGGPVNNGAPNNGTPNNGTVNNGVPVNNGTPANNGVFPEPQLPIDYIRGGTFNRLELVVDHAAGALPRDAAKEHVETEMAPLVDKPGGVAFTIRDEIPTSGSDHVWTFDELNALARERFPDKAVGDTIQIGVLYLDGSYEDDSGNSRVLGVAWANRFLVMFADSVERSCNLPLVSNEVCEAAEASVLLHEVGHVVGLVDNGAPMVMDHNDPGHPKHDSNDECVMYWAYTGSGIIDVLLSRVGSGELALTFDDACKADLNALR